MRSQTALLDILSSYRHEHSGEVSHRHRLADSQPIFAGDCCWPEHERRRSGKVGGVAQRNGHICSDPRAAAVRRCRCGSHMVHGWRSNTLWQRYILSTERGIVRCARIQPAMRAAYSGLLVVSAPCCRRPLSLPAFQPPLFASLFLGFKTRTSMCWRAGWG